METSQHNPWLPRLAKILVFATLILILIGGMVTTSGSGMAIATAPHAPSGALNPVGFTENYPTLVEHSHRLAAITVAFLTAFLCAWLWWEWAGFLAAIVLMGVCGPLGKALGIGGNALAHLHYWPAAIVFVAIAIIRARRSGQRLTTEHWLALVAFVAVCAQAVMGSLRVTLESGGDLAAATNLRTFHGIFAQAFLALVVVLAVRLCPTHRQFAAQAPVPAAGKISRMAFAAIILYFLQLSCAAYLRHRGLGLALSTWPAAQAEGGLLPAHWTHAIGIHFLHTRVLAILLAGHVIGMAIGAAKRAKGQPLLTRVAWRMLALVVLQFILGVLVIWKGRQAHITNTHVLVGALFLTQAVLLFTRASALKPRAE